LNYKINIFKLIIKMRVGRAGVFNAVR